MHTGYVRLFHTGYVRLFHTGCVGLCFTLGAFGCVSHWVHWVVFHTGCVKHWVCQTVFSHMVHHTVFHTECVKQHFTPATSGWFCTGGARQNFTLGASRVEFLHMGAVPGRSGFLQ